MPDADCIVVGAGLSGLVTARHLAEAGLNVIVFDKGRSVGGRLATRRIGDARLDHGAQFFTVRTDRFAAQVNDWHARGLTRVWCTGFGENDGHDRWIGTDGMNSLAKDLARGLDVRVDHRVFAAARHEHNWIVTCDDGSTYESSTLVLTAPVPQSFSFIFEAIGELPREFFAEDHDRTIALLATLSCQSSLPEPGALQSPSDDVAFVVDHSMKGISAVPALTLNASPSWSEHYWEQPIEELEMLLRALAEPFIGEAQIAIAQVKKWRFATPRATWTEPCWAHHEAEVVVAGDAFGGPRVEGAFLSGVAAAEVITQWCTQRR